MTGDLRGMGTTKITGGEINNSGIGGENPGIGGQIGGRNLNLKTKLDDFSHLKIPGRGVREGHFKENLRARSDERGI